MKSRVYILGVVVGALGLGFSAGVHFGKTRKPVVVTKAQLHIQEDIRHCDEIEVTPTLDAERVNPAGSLDSAHKREDYQNYATTPRSREEYEDTLSENGAYLEDPEMYEEEPPIEMLSSAEEWNNHPEGYKPLELRLYVEDEILVDRQGSLIPRGQIPYLVGHDAIESILDAQSDLQRVRYVRNHEKCLDIEIIGILGSFAEYRHNITKPRQKGGKFRDLD